MKAPDGAFWIGSDHAFDLAECYLNFRADLVLKAVPQNAVLHLSADSRYRLWINGEHVGRGPERSWPTSMAVDVRDITGHLRPGVNQIAVQVYCPGYSHFAYVHRAACGLIAWVEADGKTLLTSDQSWRVQRDLSWHSAVPRVSIYGTGVERRDLRLAENWQRAGASGWAIPRIVQPPEGPIWAGLRPRATPLPEEETRALTTAWQTRLGTTPPLTDDPHADLAAAFAACQSRPIPDQLSPGQTAIWIFDLGESRACIAGLGVTATAGDSLTISYAEKLRGGEILLSDPATYCRMRPTDRNTLRGGRQEVEGFTLRGGRYLIYRLDATEAIVPAPEFYARLPRYPLIEKPLPEFGDATLNAVAQMCRRTTLACLQDGFVDSIWRESSQWLGDVVAQSFALQAISDDPRPLRFAIDMAAEGAAEDGVLPSVLPGDVPAYVVTDYNFSWVELLATYAAHPGAADGQAVIKGHWPTLCKMLARFAQDCGEDGLIRSQAGRRLFLDWSAMARAEPNLTYNLRYLHALQLAAGLPDEQETAQWAKDAKTLSDRLHQTHCSATGWLESPDGAPASQLALALLIVTGVASGEEAAGMADQITARSLDLDDSADPAKVTLASPFMHHYVFQALQRMQRLADIRAIIKARWGRWASAGEPTTWENWGIDFPDGSACHGFSAHPLGWLVRT